MVYYGSTISPLSKRFYGHINDMKMGVYCSSQELLKLGDAYIEWVENFPCNSKKELNRREGQIQRENKGKCVNLKIAGQTKKEFYEATKPDRLAYQKIYDEAHKDVRLANARRRYKVKKTTASPSPSSSSPSIPPPPPADPSHV
jgi:hypothetical protein